MYYKQINLVKCSLTATVIFFILSIIIYDAECLKNTEIGFLNWFHTHDECGRFVRRTCRLLNKRYSNFTPNLQEYKTNNEDNKGYALVNY